MGNTAVVKCCQLCPLGQLCQSVKTVSASESEFYTITVLASGLGSGGGGVGGVITLLAEWSAQFLAY